MPIDEKMIEQLVSELRKGATTDPKVEKKGAKFSAETKGHMSGIRKSMETAGGYFGKAAAAYPDDENVSNGMAHHMAACMKMDSVLEGFGEASEDGKTPSDADSPAKAAQATELVKAATAVLEKQLAAKDTEIKALTEKNVALDKENAVLKGKLEVLGNQPTRPRAIIGGGFLHVDKGAGAESIHREASNGGAETDLTIKADDSADVKFRKALAKSYAQPSTLRSPDFKVPGDQVGA
jgi:hypothetical protein